MKSYQEVAFYYGNRKMNLRKILDTIFSSRLSRCNEEMENTLQKLESGIEPVDHPL